MFWQAGDLARAENLAQEAVALGRDLNHPFSLAISLWFGAFLAQMIGDARRAHEASAELIDVASRHTFALPLAVGQIIQGWAMTQDGNLAGGVEQMERAFTGLLEAKQRAYLTYLGTVVAGAKLELGQVEEALAFLDKVEALSMETHQQMFIPDLHRLRGDALRRLDPRSDRIDVCYRSALSLAEQQGAPALAERARNSRDQWLAARG